MKRFRSGLAVALGLIGTVICVLLILGLWMFHSSINKSIVSFIAPVETIVSSIDEQVATLEGRIEGLQDEVIADLLEKTHAIKTASPDVEIDTTPILEGIEGRLEPSIEALKSELRGLEPQLHATMQLLSMAKTFLPQDVQVVIESRMNERVATTSSNLAATQTRLQELKDDLSSLTVSTDTERLERLEDRIQGLDSQLNNVDALLDEFGASINRLQDALNNGKQRIRLGLVLATLALSLLASWSTWAQWTLFQWGLQKRKLRG